MQSQNFEFLRDLWPNLADLAGFSEQYILTDPQASVAKLRIFAEASVNIIYLKLSIVKPSIYTFSQMLTNGAFKSSVPRSIVNKLHLIRLAGNEAAHEDSYSISDEEILATLREGFELGQWLFITYGNGDLKNIPDFEKPQAIIKDGEYDNQKQNNEDLIKEALTKLKIEQEKNSILKGEVNKSENELYKIRKNAEFNGKQAAENLNLNEEKTSKHLLKLQEKSSIFDSFANYELTTNQTELVGLLEQFLKSKDQKCFLLQGYAGTGKTFITKGLTEYFEEIGRRFILAAPTGKAAKVISQKTLQEAYTIHKTIYSDKEIKQYETEKIEGTETYKFYFDLRVNDDDVQTVYIIDEASMISNTYQEDEFFRSGSGFVLNDLMEYINLDNNDHNKKIIFIGDKAQLPPVSMKFSPALDQQYLAQKFGVKTTTYELKDVVRQSQHSGILQNSITLRNTIKSNIFNQLDFDLSYPDVGHVDHDKLLNQYLNACDNQINEEAMIIAYSNNSVKEYNDRIRDVFFPNNKEVAIGDRLLVTSNNSNHIILIANGDFGVVKHVDNFSEVRKIPLKKKNEETNVVEKFEVILTFKNLVIEFIDLKGEHHEVTCKIVENLLYSSEAKLSSDENKAIYVDFLIRNRALRPGTKEFKDELRNDPYFNALKVKFGYAITCHKAQGSEWNQVFVNCKVHQNQMSEAYFRWLYTAITRASKKLYMLDEPHYKYGSTMTRFGTEKNKFNGTASGSTSTNQNAQENTVSSSDVLSKNSHDTQKSEALSDKPVQSISEEYKLDSDNALHKILFSKIKKLIEIHDIKILDVQHHEYHDIYQFEYNNNNESILVYYSAKNMITHVTAVHPSKLSDGLLRVLSALENIMLVDNDVKSKATFKFDEDFQKVQFNFILNAVEKHNISIDNILHNPYQEKYYFVRGDEFAVFIFYYNGKKQFGKWDPEGKNNNSKILVNDIIAAIEQA